MLPWVMCWNFAFVLINLLLLLLLVEQGSNSKSHLCYFPWAVAMDTHRDIVLHHHFAMSHDILLFITKQINFVVLCVWISECACVCVWMCVRVCVCVHVCGCV